MGRTTIAFAAVAGVIVQAASAGVIRHDRDDQHYLDLAHRPEFASVGQLYLTDGPFAIGLCSATLISDRWVLTAGHCTTIIDEASDMLFVLDGNIRRGTQLELHPGILDPDIVPLDMALFRLDEPITSVEPAPLYSGDQELGKLATSVGYGRTGTGLTGPVEGSKGERRAGQNIIDDLDEYLDFGPTLIGYDFDNPDDPGASTLGDPSAIDLEYLVAPGDSGGGTFILDDDGTWRLAGVHSFVASTGSGMVGDYGDIAGMARVSHALPWILSTIPSPASLAALTPLLAARRRR